MGNSIFQPDAFSVTRILQPHSPYEEIPEALLIPAQARGTAVHSYCSALVRHVWPEPLHSLYQGYGESFKKYLPEIIRPLIVEERLESKRFRYHGHPDMVVIMRNEKRRLIDLKTGGQPNPIWQLQLSAYWWLIKENGVEIDEAGNLILDAGGELPQYIPYPEFKVNFAIWYGYLQAYQFIHGKEAMLDARRI